MRLVAVLAVAVLLGACGANEAPLRILSLGDSYTIGESVAETDRWPNQLGRELEAEGYGEATVRIIARTGWTTRELDAGIDAADPDSPYDLVTLQIGVNDQFRGLDPETFRAGFDALLDRAFDLSAGPVVVVSIPDWGTTPFGGRYDRERVALEIDEFNAIAREAAGRAGAEWVYVTPISRSDIPGIVATDGLHPSGLQYGLWVEEMLPAVREALGGP